MTMATKQQLSDTDTKKGGAKYSLMKASEVGKTLKDLFFDEITDLRKETTEARQIHTKKVLDDIERKKATFHSPESMFSSIAGAYTGAVSHSDADLIKPLFKTEKDWMAKFSGCRNANEMAARFERSRELVFRLFYNYAEILQDASFPGTYYHKDISGLFLQQAQKIADKVKGDASQYALYGMYNKAHAEKRVSATAAIVLRIAYGNLNYPWTLLYGRRSLVSMLQLSALHHGEHVFGYSDENGLPRYNSSSVAFTLLTFSYFMGIAINKNANEKKHLNDWYFFWKTLGSCLGLVECLLPSTHDEAKALFKAFTESNEIVCPKSIIQLEDNLQTIDFRKHYVLNSSVTDELTGKGEAVSNLQKLIKVYREGVAVDKWTGAKWIIALYRSQGWKETLIVDAARTATTALASYGGYFVMLMLLRKGGLIAPPSS